MSKRQYLDTKAVAERVGVKRRSITEYLSRGSMPEPDAVMLGHPLWLETTIDEWQKVKGTRGRFRRAPRRLRPPAPEPEQLWERPPLMTRPSDGASASSNGASADSAPRRRAPVGEGEARAIAAAVREAGFHCTSADVLELLRPEPYGAPPLEHERELLRQRIVAKWRHISKEEETDGST